MADQEGCARTRVRIYEVLEGAEDGPRAMIPFVDKLLKENLDILDTKDLQMRESTKH